MTNFDLISDLHLDRWANNRKDWRGTQTSQNCVIAGDISSNLRLSLSFIKHLSDCYEQVIFVDGNHEHKARPFNIERNEKFMDDFLNQYSNVTYLSDATTIIDGVAFVGSNGWWTYDYQEMFAPGTRQDCIDMFCDTERLEFKDAMMIWQTAQEQAEFMSRLVATMQEDETIESIVMVTHTVPRPDLFYANCDLVDYAKLGNSSYQNVIDADYKNKISTWCFGHYHSTKVDTEIGGIRYISNPRGTPDTALSPIYHPMLIKVNESSDGLLGPF